MEAWKGISWLRNCTIILFDPWLTLLKTYLTTSQPSHSWLYRYHPKQGQCLPSSPWATVPILCSKTPLTAPWCPGTWENVFSWPRPARKAGNQTKSSQQWPSQQEVQLILWLQTHERTQTFPNGIISYTSLHHFSGPSLSSFACCTPAGILFPSCFPPQQHLQASPRSMWPGQKSALVLSQKPGRESKHKIHKRMKVEMERVGKRSLYGENQGKRIKRRRRNEGPETPWCQLIQQCCSLWNCTDLAREMYFLLLFCLFFSVLFKDFMIW